MPRQVVPIFFSPRRSSEKRSARGCQGMMRWAPRLTATRAGPAATPWASRSPISLKKAAGAITRPFPMTQSVPAWRMPEGMRWSTIFRPRTQTVWPALCPP